MNLIKVLSAIVILFSCFDALVSIPIVFAIRQRDAVITVFKGVSGVVLLTFSVEIFKLNLLIG